MDPAGHEQARGGAQEAGGQQGPDAETRHQRGADADAGADPDPERQVGQAAFQRGVAQHLLLEQGQQEEVGEERGGEQQGGGVGDHAGAVGEEPQRDQRRRRAGLDRDHDRRQGDAAEQRQQHLPRRPRVRGGLQQGVDDRDQGAGPGDRPGEVDPAVLAHHPAF